MRVLLARHASVCVTKLSYTILQLLHTPLFKGQSSEYSYYIIVFLFYSSPFNYLEKTLPLVESEMDDKISAKEILISVLKLKRPSQPQTPAMESARFLANPKGPSLEGE